MGPPGLEPGTLELLFPPFNQLSYGPAPPLYANPVLLLSDRTKLLYPGLRPLDVRQAVVVATFACLNICWIPESSTLHSIKRGPSPLRNACQPRQFPSINCGISRRDRLSATESVRHVMYSLS